MCFAAGKGDPEESEEMKYCFTVVNVPEVNDNRGPITCSAPEEKQHVPETGPERRACFAFTSPGRGRIGISDPVKEERIPVQKQTQRNITWIPNHGQNPAVL